MKGMRLALIGVTALSAVSTILFLTQGGFGGGHGDLDKPLFIMGLPWAAIHWPDMLVKHDFVWLIVLPLCLNVAAVLGVAALVRARRRSNAAIRH
jgi:hypothetical protein